MWGGIRGNYATTPQHPNIINNKYVEPILNIMNIEKMKRDLPGLIADCRELLDKDDETRRNAVEDIGRRLDALE